MIKVAFTPDIFVLQDKGGISRYYVELARALRESNEVLPIVYGPSWLGRVHDLTTSLNSQGLHGLIPFLAQRIHRSVTAKFIRSLTRIEAENIDVIHATYYDVYRRPGAPLVATFYDLIPESLGTASTRAQRQRIVSAADLILCISDNTKKRLVDTYGVTATKIRVTHLGCSLQHVRPAWPQILDTNISDFALFVGNRSGYKNFSTLIEAFVETELYHRGGKMICVGGQKFSLEEKELFLKIGIDEDRLLQVELSDSELAALYRSAAVYVCSSLDEGFGLPALEALSLGCPVVVSNRGALPEVCDSAALYFNPDDLLSIRNAMDEAVLDQAGGASRILLGLQRSQKFSWLKCAEETTRAYKYVLQQH